MKKLIFTKCLLLSCFFSFAQPDIALETYVDGLVAPLDIENAGDERLFVVEQRGMIRIVDGDGNLLSEPFLDIRSRASSGGERGLLGLTFHPDYASNGWFYVNYTNIAGDTRISRFNRSSGDPDKADPASEKILLEVDQPASNHNAGDLNFGPDGYLYFGLGDGGSAGDPWNNAQTEDVLLGKMLRIDVDQGDDYVVPDDNPFVDDPDYRPEIWAMGLRNPWKFSFDRETGDMWIADVGQNSWEEIDFQPADSEGGENYGWSCIEGLSIYKADRCASDMNIYTDPAYVYPNNNSSGCSVTGGYVYRGCTYPRLYGLYIMSDYCSGRFRYVDYCPEDTCAQEFIGGELANLDNEDFVSFGEDINGELYVAGISSGAIYRLIDQAEVFEAPEIDSTGGVLSVADEFDSYQWLFNGAPIQGADESTFMPLLTGTYSLEVTNSTGCMLTTDSVLVEITSSVSILPGVRNLIISPNPARHTIFINYWTESVMDMKIRIYNNMGQEIISRDVTGSGEMNVPVNIDGFYPGLYLITLSNGRDFISARIVKD